MDTTIAFNSDELKDIIWNNKDWKTIDASKMTAFPGDYYTTTTSTPLSWDISNSPSWTVTFDKTYYTEEDLNKKIEEERKKIVRNLTDLIDEATFCNYCKFHDTNGSDCHECVAGGTNVEDSIVKMLKEGIKNNEF